MQLRKFTKSNGIFPESANYPVIKDNVLYSGDTNTLKYYREPYIRLWANEGTIPCNIIYESSTSEGHCVNDSNYVYYPDSNYKLNGYTLCCGYGQNASVTLFSEYVESAQADIEREGYDEESFGFNERIIINTIDSETIYYCHPTTKLLYAGCVVFYVTIDNPSELKIGMYIYHRDDEGVPDFVLNEFTNDLEHVKTCADGNEEGYAYDDNGYIYIPGYGPLILNKRSEDDSLPFTYLSGTKINFNDRRLELYGNDAITKVLFSKGVTKIPDNYLKECGNLETVIIGSNVTSIGEYAFFECFKLKNVEMPDSVVHIDDFAFWDCRSLSAITLSNSLTEISGDCFRHCALTTINIPDSVHTIGFDCFDECYSLSSITLSNSVTNIKDCAFRDCRNLTSINLPDSLRVIGEETFVNCYNLTSIVLPESITTVGSDAFDNCSSLSFVRIENPDIDIASDAFYNCTNLTAIYFKGTVPNGKWGATNATIITDL